MPSATDVSSPEFGLSPTQQDLFSDDVMVGAVPIRLATDELVGALSVASHPTTVTSSPKPTTFTPTGLRCFNAWPTRSESLLSVEGMEMDW